MLTEVRPLFDELQPAVWKQQAWRSVICIGALSFCTLAGNPALAQLRDSFESPQPTWVLAEADCGVRKLGQQRSYRDSHSGQASENFRLQIGNGTKVYLTQAIGRVPIIQELRPSLFLKADRANLQLMARVVLPRSIDRGSGKPLTTMLRGDVYSEVGNWQQLEIRDVQKLLTVELAVLRTVHGKDVDAREAYVDLIVLNAFSAPGNVEIWLDDLEIQGYVNLDENVGAQIAQRPSSAINAATGSRQPFAEEPAATVQGSLLLVRGRPMMPRVIQHQGEPLEWLKSLGFNTIKLSSSPAEAELKEAQRLGLWLIAPPPYGDRLRADESLTPVLAWSLGSRLTERDLPGTRQLASEIRRFEPQHQRPLLCGADADLAEYSRLASILMIERNPLGTSLELANMRHWMISRPRLARAGTPFLATLAIERPEKLAEQLVLFGQGSAFEEDLDPEQLRLAAYSALAAGARGLVLPSRSPLGMDSPTGALRTDSVKLLNMELKLLEPWISAGSLTEELAAGDGSVQVSVLQTERSRLLLITQHAPAQQFVLGPPARNSLQVTAPGVGSSDKAYQVSLAGIKQLRMSHSSSGANLTIEDAGFATAVVVTQDPLAMHHLNRTLANMRMEAARLRYDIAARRLASLLATDQQLGVAGKPLAAADAWLREGQASLEHAKLLLDGNDLENMHPAVARAEQQIAKVRRGHWEQTAAGFPSPVASPCIAQFTTLPLHWSVARRMQQGRFGPNEQAAGDMESLDQMLQAQWQQHRQPPAGVATDVTLSLQAPHSGRSALRMQAWVSDPKRVPQIIERPIVWIVSAPVPVRQGQIARIHAWVHVPRPIGGTTEGLLAFDSLGGVELGDRIRLTQGWRELTLYRAVPASGQLTVTFALTGLGEAWVDDLSVSLLDPDPIRPTE